MFTNDLKKGTRVRLRETMWEADLMDNKKGNIRMADVFGDFHEGDFHEMGSVYAHDIIAYKDSNGNWQHVNYTKAQIELRQMCQFH